MMGLFRQPPPQKQPGGNDELTGKLMELLIELRAEARKKKDFATADQIRNALAEIGVVLEDRPAARSGRRRNGRVASGGGLTSFIHDPAPHAIRPHPRHRPGLNITGYGVLESAAGRCGCARRAWSAASRAARSPAGLLEIHQGVADVIAALRPGVMALEQLYSHYERPRTAILMGHARGVICLAAAQAGIPVVHYAATQVKKILTGAGRAGRRRCSGRSSASCTWPQLPEPPDVADALAIALCHCYLEG